MQAESTGHELLTISRFGNSSFQRKQYRKVRVTLYSQYDNRPLEIEALEVPEICKDLSPLTEQHAFQHMKDDQLSFADVAAFDIQPDPGINILIGADFYWTFVTGDIKRLNESLTAVNTAVGWTLHGNSVSVTNSGRVEEVKTFHVSTGEISHQLKQFWEIEHLGLKDEPQFTDEEHDVFEKDASRNRLKNEMEQYEDVWRQKMKELGSAVARLQEENSKLSSSLKEKECRRSQHGQPYSVMLDDDVVVLEGLRDAFHKQSAKLSQCKREMATSAADIESLQQQLEASKKASQEQWRRKGRLYSLGRSSGIQKLFQCVMHNLQVPGEDPRSEILPERFSFLSALWPHVKPG
ncbi:uncharacterized protein LOC144145394 [Haemaphysalis longicornis]